MRALLLAWTLFGVLVIGLQPTTASAASAVSTVPGISSELTLGQSLAETVSHRGYCHWHKKCGWKRVCWWKHGYKHCSWKRRCWRWCHKHHRKRYGIYFNVY